MGLRNGALSEKLQMDADLSFQTAISTAYQRESVRKQQSVVRGDSQPNVDAVSTLMVRTEHGHSVDKARMFCGHSMNVLQTQHRHSGACCAAIHRSPQWNSSEFVGCCTIISTFALLRDCILGCIVPMFDCSLSLLLLRIAVTSAMHGLM